MDGNARRKRIGLALVLGVFALVLGLSAILYGRVREWTGEPDRRDAEAKEAIETVLSKQAEAWNRGDLDGFMDGYWDSPELEFVSSTTTKGFGPTKERYFKRYKAEGKEMGTLTFSDIAVSLNGDQEATATGKWKVVMSKESPSGGFTLTLRKFENGWKIVKDVTTSDEPPKK